MLVPNPNVESCDKYNLEQISNRMQIECVFVMLVNEWPIVWHRINENFELRVPLSNACFYLRNFCIDRKIKRKTLRFPKMIMSKFNFLWEPWVLRGPKILFWQKNGCPVEYLNWDRENKKASSDQNEVRNIFFTGKNCVIAW